MVAVGTGCSFVDLPDGSTTDPPTGGGDEASTRVAVVLSGAPGGLQKYSCTVSNEDEGVIEQLRPELITGEQFQVVEGGTGSASATVRAADLAQQVQGFEDERMLFSMTYDRPVSDVTLELGTLTDDEGEEMSPDRVRVSDLSSQ